jgi:hypothetical protein
LSLGEARYGLGRLARGAQRSRTREGPAGTRPASIARMRILIVASIGLATAACAKPYYIQSGVPEDTLIATARTRATHEFSCTADRVQVKTRFDLTADTVEVQACGAHAIYTCPPVAESSHNRWAPAAARTCIEEPERPAVAAEAPNGGAGGHKAKDGATAKNAKAR